MCTKVSVRFGSVRQTKLEVRFGFGKKFLVRSFPSTHTLGEVIKLVLPTFLENIIKNLSSSIEDFKLKG